jgi:hypothetical protein
MGLVSGIESTPESAGGSESGEVSGGLVVSMPESVAVESRKGPSVVDDSGDGGAESDALP